jgi:hypothetical protein
MAYPLINIGIYLLVCILAKSFKKESSAISTQYSVSIPLSIQSAYP